MGRKLIAVTLIVLVAFQGAQFSAAASNKFLDAQAKVHHQIFQPASTGDLILRLFELQSCGPTNEKSLVAIYGEARSIQILQTDAKDKCSNPGLGVKVATATINGNKATIVAFCDPANKTQWKNCKTSDIHNYGGYAMWKVPATKSLHGSEIEVLVSGLTYSDLLKIARGMKAVSKQA
jgi:hypothetical protein